MRIAVDAMGGDNAPDAIIAGCLDSVELLGEEDELVLVGDQQIIADALAADPRGEDPRLKIEAAGDVIEMHESPVQAVREKPDSSMVVAANLGSRKAGEKLCDVVISAGNTGACVAAAQMAMRRLPGVHRPGIGVTLPTFHGPVVICDVGANPEPKPHHLHQYGHMAAAYAQRIVGKENPRVALLNIGGEEGKGSQLVRETSQLMKADDTLNYTGYVEGRSLFEGEADVVICEGFTGNVVLKLAEGLSAGLFATISHEILEEDPSLAPKFQPIVEKIYSKHDYHEFGGAPLLGANGICMICHGSSKARTIRSAVRNAMAYARQGVNDQIVQMLSDVESVTANEESAV